MIFFKLIDDNNLQLMQNMFIITMRKIESGTDKNTVTVLIFVYSTDSRHT